jgi:hypothetical protein
VMPSGREEALQRAGAGVIGFIQGEVLALPDACVVVADAAWPLDDASAEVAAEEGDDGLILVPEAVDVIVLLTQTCDLQETTPEQRNCQVAPVVERGETFAREVLRGRRPGWVALPWYRRAAVAELARITTLERSVLVGARSLARPDTPRERLHFAESVSRHFTRAALPDPVVEVLRPLLERMRDRSGRASDEGRCIEQIATIRVEAVPDLDAPAPHLTVLLVLDVENLPSIGGAELDHDGIDDLVSRGRAAAATAAQRAADPIAKREAWIALTELWLQPAVELAEATPGVDSIDVLVLNGDELSFARARNAPELDLAYLSTRPP